MDGSSVHWSNTYLLFNPLYCINASSGHIDISDNIIIDTNRKSRCFTAGGNSGGLHSQMDLIKCVAMRGRNPENPKSRKAQLETEQQLEPRTDGKTNCLTSVQKDNLLMEKSPCLHGFAHGTNGQFNNQLANGGMIRRLTPVECERLQTVKDNYTACVSETQRYRMLGNGWTVSVVSHIFSYCLMKKSKRVFDWYEERQRAQQRRTNRIIAISLLIVAAAFFAAFYFGMF